MSGPRSRDAHPAQRFDNCGMTLSIAVSGVAHAPTPPIGLSPQQLVGQRGRLERELAHAFGIHPLPGALIERLVEEITAIERGIEDLQGAVV
jgi:hypothetical protein